MTLCMCMEGDKRDDWRWDELIWGVFDEEQTELNVLENPCLKYKTTFQTNFSSSSFHSLHQHILFLLPFFPSFPSCHLNHKKKARTLSIMKAKSLFSNGDVERAFAVLKKSSLKGDGLACFDAGFMMIQGIGCERDCEGVMKLLGKGCDLVRDLKWWLLERRWEFEWIVSTTINEFEQVAFEWWFEWWFFMHIHDDMWIMWLIFKVIIHII